MTGELDPITLWTVIAGLAAGSYALRFLFIGLVGDRPLPPWMMRHLRYTAVAMIPALIAPLVAWPDATGGQLDAPRAAAAAMTCIVGLWTRNILLAVLAGAGTLYAMLYLVG